MSTFGNTGKHRPGPGPDPDRCLLSQGQQRTAILSMKLSEMEFIRKETGEYPVLLLDDIGSELDRSRRAALLSFLTEQDIQTLVTGTEKMFEGEGKVVTLG